MRNLVFYPEIEAFIEEEKDEFPALIVQYAYRSPPKVIMLDKDGQHTESIRSVFLDVYSLSGTSDMIIFKLF